MTRSPRSLPLFPRRQEQTPHPRVVGDGAIVAPSRASQLWLCLRLPSLPLEIFAATKLPFAVVEGEGSPGIIVACNERAAAGGVRAGLATNAALALEPELLVRRRVLPYEQTALERVAVWAGQLTSLVHLEPPDAVLAEVRGSLRLFGGLERLLAHAREGLAGLGYRLSLAVAPTPRAACWLARAGDEVPVIDESVLAGRLGRLPLTATGWPATLIRALTGMGVRNLGDCMRLPREGFARRFGAARLIELDRALGRSAEVRRPFEPPPRFASRLEFPLAVTGSELLQHPIVRLLTELEGFLCSRQAGVQDVELVLEHTCAEPTRVELGLAQPRCEAQVLAHLLTVRLERTLLPHPVSAIALRTKRVRPLAPTSGTLYATHDQDTLPWSDLLERLRARLGARAVHGVALVAEHRPERAWRVCEPGIGKVGPARARRPLWLLEKPDLLACADNGTPLYAAAPLELLDGPERIESGWWDGQDVRRDYYIARTGDGAMLWVYREPTRRWFVHGYFG